VTETTRAEYSAQYLVALMQVIQGVYEIEVKILNQRFLGTVMWVVQNQLSPITNGSRSTNISYAGKTLS
jgi:hypothetical protein